MDQRRKIIHKFKYFAKAKENEPIIQQEKTRKGEKQGQSGGKALKN